MCRAIRFTSLGFHAALSPPENADFIGKAAIEKVVGFPYAGNDDARADAYRLRIAAAGHNDEVLIVFNERDLQGGAKAFGGGIENRIGLQDALVSRRSGVAFWSS